MKNEKSTDSQVGWGGYCFPQKDGAYVCDSSFPETHAVMVQPTRFDRFVQIKDLTHDISIALIVSMTLIVIVRIIVKSIERVSIANMEDEEDGGI